MEPRLLFLILVGIAIGLSCLAGYWRKKAGEAAFAAAIVVIYEIFPLIAAFLI